MNFQLSQVILILTIILFLLYVFRVRTVLTDRIIYLILVLGGLIFIIYPDFSTWIANLIGVGRGTDFLLYIFVVFSLFHYVGNASRFKNMEQQITSIVRNVAITEILDQEEVN